MLFAAIFVAIFGIAAFALTIGMYARRESMLGLYSVTAALVAAIGAVVFASLKGNG